MLETAPLPHRYLRTAEAGDYLGLSGRTLEKHRTFGTGPRYRKIGGRVVYAITDLDAWADLGAQTATAGPDVGRIPATSAVRNGREPEAAPTVSGS